MRQSLAWPEDSPRRSPSWRRRPRTRHPRNRARSRSKYGPDERALRRRHHRPVQRGRRERRRHHQVRPPHQPGLPFRAPLKLSVEELAGREKISYLPRKLKTKGSPGSDPENGDLIYYAPWGNLGFYYDAAGIGFSRDTVISAATGPPPSDWHGSSAAASPCASFVADRRRVPRMIVATAIFAAVALSACGNDDAEPQPRRRRRERRPRRRRARVRPRPGRPRCDASPHHLRRYRTHRAAGRQRHRARPRRPTPAHTHVQRPQRRREDRATPDELSTEDAQGAHDPLRATSATSHRAAISCSTTTTKRPSSPASSESADSTAISTRSRAKATSRGNGRQRGMTRAQSARRTSSRGSSCGSSTTAGPRRSRPRWVVPVGHGPLSGHPPIGGS